MLIKDLNKYLKERKGVIHIGANDGGERDWYVDNGFSPVIWFEPNPEVFIKLHNNLQDSKYSDQYCYNYGVHDTLTKTILHVANNEGQSSSILPLGLHKQYHPKVKYVKDIEIELVRLDTFISTYSFLKNINFNFLNIDVQGCELNVIRSFGQDISKLDYIYTEVNTAEVYEGCSLLKDIDLYLNSFGFIRVETKMTKNQWGDAFYINTLKNEA
jgi:FkbM family methyltransferase